VIVRRIEDPSDTTNYICVLEGNSPERRSQLLRLGSPFSSGLAVALAAIGTNTNTHRQHLEDFAERLRRRG